MSLVMFYVYLISRTLGMSLVMFLCLFEEHFMSIDLIADNNVTIETLSNINDKLER